MMLRKNNLRHRIRYWVYLYHQKTPNHLKSADHCIEQFVELYKQKDPVWASISLMERIEEVTKVFQNWSKSFNKEEKLLNAEKGTSKSLKSEMEGVLSQIPDNSRLVTSQITTSKMEVVEPETDELPSYTKRKFNIQNRHVLVQFLNCPLTKEEVATQLACRLNPKAYFRVSEPGKRGTQNVYIYLHRNPSFRFLDTRNFRVTKTGTQYFLPSHCFAVLQKGAVRYLSQKDKNPVTNLKPTLWKL